MKKYQSKSYTNQKLGFRSRFGEILALLRIYRTQTEPRTISSLREISNVTTEVSSLIGREFEGLKILEVGSGQRSTQLAYLALKNDVVGIDREDSSLSMSPLNIIRTIRSDGVIRALKTIGRRCVGVDSQVKETFYRETGKQWPQLNVLKMDADNLSFADQSFDFVYSRAVFEHLADPAKVLSEIRRVLKPNGIFYCLLHLYSSYNGSHDMRAMLNSKDYPPWAHLRPNLRFKVIENSFLNRFRLQDWKQTFNESMPGVSVFGLKDDTNNTEILKQLKTRGELASYSEEELLSVTVKAVWQKSV